MLLNELCSNMINKENNFAIGREMVDTHSQCKNYLYRMGQYVPYEWNVLRIC